jgi:hypothetical protein
MQDGFSSSVTIRTDAAGAVVQTTTVDRTPIENTSESEETNSGDEKPKDEKPEDEKPKDGDGEDEKPKDGDGEDEKPKDGDGEDERTSGDEPGSHRPHVPLPTDGTDTGAPRDRNSPYVLVAPENPGRSPGGAPGPDTSGSDPSTIGYWTEDMLRVFFIQAVGAGQVGSRPGTPAPEYGPNGPKPMETGGRPPRDPNSTDPISTTDG